MSQPPDQILRFGVFELDTARGELKTRAGTIVPLQPQPLKVLTLLARRAGCLVTREEIRLAIWGSDTYVDFDRGLNFCVKEVRSALGDDSRLPRYIETVPRRGYRFLVTENQSGIPAKAIQTTESKRVRRTTRWLTTSLLLVAALALVIQGGTFVHPKHRGAAKRVLAVLPFENLSGDLEQEYLADGMTEELIAQIGRLSPDSLAVIARGSTMKYKRTTKEWRQVAAELGADYVVQGTVRRGPTAVYVTSVLLSETDTRPLWTGTETASTADLFAAQRDTARHIARVLALGLLPAEPAALARSATEDTAAFEAYLMARHALRLGTEEGFQAASVAFEDAAQRDPKFAPAFAGIAAAQLSLAEFRLSAPEEACRLARPHAERAVALDPSLPEAHARLAQAWSMCSRSSPLVDAEYRLALALNPSDADAHEGRAWFLFDSRREREARTEIETALRLDPMSPLAHASAAYFLVEKGDYGGGLDCAREALALEPDYPFGLYVLGRALSLHGRHREAIAALEKAVAVTDGKPKYVFGLGMVSAQAGRRDQATQMLVRLRNLARHRYVPPTYIALLTKACSPIPAS